MRAPFVRGDLNRVLDQRRVQYRVPQPRRIGSLQVESVTEHPGLVAAARMHWVPAIVLDLTDVEDRSLPMRETMRHAGPSPTLTQRIGRLNDIGTPARSVAGRIEHEPLGCKRFRQQRPARGEILGDRRLADAAQPG